MLKLESIIKKMPNERDVISAASQIFPDPSFSSPYTKAEEDRPKILIKPIKMGGTSKRDSTGSRKNASPPLLWSSPQSSAPSQERLLSTSPD